MGLAMIFGRLAPPAVLSIPVGHVGWAFELQNGKYFAGATELITRDAVTIPDIPAGEWNGSWSKELDSMADVVQVFTTITSDHPWLFQFWKGYTVASPNYEAALQVGSTNKDKGWRVIGNNCLDHATDVLEKYGVPWQQIGGQPVDAMPWKHTNPFPLQWLNNWNVPCNNLLGQPGR